MTNNKKQSTYLFNARRSLKNLGKSTIEDYLPNTTNAVGSIREGVKSATNVGDSRIGFNIIRNRLRSNPLVDFTNTFFRNAYQGIKTGNFYKSTEESFGLDMPDIDIDMNSFISDLDDANADADSYESTTSDFEIADASTSSLQGTISDGDQAVVSTTIEASKANASVISNTIAVGLTELKGTIMKSDSTLGSISNNIIEGNKLYSSLLNIQTESLVELKALRTMFGEYALTDNKNNSNGMGEGTPNGSKKWFEDLKYGNKNDGVKDLIHGVMRSIDAQKSQGVMNQLVSMIPMLTMMYGNNPFGAVKDLFVMPKLEEKYGLKDISTKIESVVTDIPTMINKQFKTMSLSDNDLIRGIGQDMKVTPNLNASIRTDNYAKERKVFFDGMTKEAIINVIPTQLSAIVSLLSGKERTVYNYDRGKFQTMSDAKNTFKEYMPKLDYDYSALSSIIEQFSSTEDATSMNPEALNKFAKTFMERLSERGYDLSDVKNMRYDDMLAITDIDSDNFDKSDYIKIKTAISNAEKDRYASAGIVSLNRKINDYIRDKERYIKEQASTLRKTGLISTVNRSELLDSGATLGTVTGIATDDKNNTISPSRKPHEYTNLFSDLDKDGNYNTSLNALPDEEKAKKRSIFKYKLNDDDMSLIDKYNDTELGGFGTVRGNIKHTVQMLMSSRFFETNDMNKEKWYKDIESKSDYDYNDILMIMRKKAEAKEKAILKAKEEAKERGEELPEDFTLEDDDTHANGIKGLLGSLKLGKLRAKVSKNFSKMMSEFKEESADVLGEAYTYYDKHTEGVKKFAKISAVGLGGLGLSRLLKNTSIGKSVSALGILSPIGLAAAGVGTGLYLNRDKIMNAIIGDDEHRAEFAKRNFKIAKYSIANTAGLAVGSGALSLLTGGSIGMLGPIGLAVGGLAMGISSQSSKFNEILFGNGENSFSQNLKEWLFGNKEDKRGLLSGKMTEVKKTFAKMGSNLEGWFKTQIGYPVRDIYKTLSVTAGNIIQKLGSKLSGIPMQVGLGVSAAISKSVTKPLVKYLEKGFSPISKMIKGVFGKATGIAGKIISAPFKFARTIITGKTDNSSYAERFYGKDYDKLGKKEKKQLSKEQEMNVKVHKANSLSDLVDEGTTKSDKKKIRKLYTRKMTGIENPKAEDEEAGKGIDIKTSKKFYYNQKSRFYSKIAFSSGASVASNGCGLMVMAQALSIATKQKISPLHLMNESEKYQHDNSGLPRDFFKYMCGLYDVPYAVYESPNAFLVQDALDKGASVILDMADVDTGMPHYVLITKSNKNDEFIYSDPARKANMKLPQAVMMAKAKKLFCVVVFPKKSTNRMKAREFYSEINAPRLDYDIPQEKFQKNRKPTQLTKHINAINDVYNTSGIESNKKGKHSTSGYRFDRKIQDGVDSKVKDKIISDEEKHKNISNILNEIRKFRRDYSSGSTGLEDTIDIATTGVAYNLEYMRRILTREFGKVDDKDIDGSTGMIDALDRYKGKIKKRIKRIIRRTKNFAKDFTTLVYDNTIGRIKKTMARITDTFNNVLTKVSKKIEYVLTLPKKLYGKIYGQLTKFGKVLIKTKDVFKKMIPSKQTIINAYKLANTMMSRTYKASKIVLGDLRKGLITVVKDIRSGTISLFKGATKGLANMAKYSLGLVKNTYGLVKKGFKALGNTWLGQKVLHPLKTGKSIVDAFKKKVNITLAPREVFVTGGTINTVQTVNTVKSVGAVDLEYAESINKKNVSVKDSIKDAVDKNKEFKGYDKYKDISMKRGLEYHKIDKRQDKENDKGNGIISERGVATVPQPNEQKGGLIPAILRNSAFGMGIKGALGIATGIVTSIATGLGVAAFTDTGRELIGGVYNQFGLNGDVDATSVAYKAPRKMLKGLISGIGHNIAKVTKFAPKSYLGKQSSRAAKYLAKSLKNLAKGMPSKITRFLENIFKSKVIRKVIPDRFIAKLFGVIPKIAKMCAKRSSKSLAKAGVRLGAYAFPPLGAILDIGFAVFDLVSGMKHAKDYFRTDGHVTLGMRMTAGVVNCLIGFAASKFPPLAFIPVDLLTKLVYDAFKGDDDKGYEPKYDDKDNDIIEPKKSKNIFTADYQNHKPVIQNSVASITPTSKPAVTKPKTIFSASYQDAREGRLTGFGSQSFAMNDNDHIEKGSSWLKGLSLDMIRNFAGSKTDEPTEESELTQNAKPNGAKIGNYKIPDPKGIIDSFNYTKDKYGKKIANDAMGIAWAESNWTPTVKNRIGAEGLFQIIKRYRKSWGFKPTEAPSTMPALEQTKRVIPEILKKVRRKNATPNLTNLYSALHYPVAVDKPNDYILYGKHKNPTAYKYNKGIDLSFGNRDGNVSKSELSKFVHNKASTAMSLLPQLYETKNNTSSEFISQKYGKYNMLDMGGMKFKDAGCGPAVMGMLLSDLGIKYKMKNLVQLALNKRTSPTDGTPVEYFIDTLSKFGIRGKLVKGHLASTIINELKAGRSVIVLTRNKQDSNHYILARKLSADGNIVISDPEKHKSETVGILDYRIRNAIAVVTYADKKTQRKRNFFEGMYSGFGNMGGILKNLAQDALRVDLSNPNVHDIVNNISSSYKDKARDIISSNATKYTNEAKSLLDEQVSPYKKSINDGVKSVQAEHDRIRQMTADITAKREALKAQAINGIPEVDASDISKNITKVIKSMPTQKISTEAKHTNNKVTEPQTIDQSTLLSKLSTIITLLNTTNDLLKNGLQVRKIQTPLTINNKKVFETKSGKATPVIIDGETEMDGGNVDDWVRMVTRIAHGS